MNGSLESMRRFARVPSRRHRVAWPLWFVAVSFYLGTAPGCRGYYSPWDRGIDGDSPPRGPEAACARACAKRVVACSAHECARGCNLVIDRLVENEGNRVLACMGAAPRPCDDRAWAHCATLVGPHADGGPPAPRPPGDLDDDEP
jgi:hypothetical protein